MGQIYRKCEARTTFAHNQLISKELEDNGLETEPSQFRDFSGLAAYIAGLGRREYFSRTWIVQEVLLAQDIIIFCGDSQLSWDDFAKLFSQIEKSVLSE